MSTSFFFLSPSPVVFLLATGGRKRARKKRVKNVNHSSRNIKTRLPPPLFPYTRMGKQKKYTSQNMGWVGGAVFFLLSPFWSGNKGGPNKKSRIRKKGESKGRRVLFFFPKAKHVRSFSSPPQRNLSCTSHIWFAVTSSKNISGTIVVTSSNVIAVTLAKNFTTPVTSSKSFTTPVTSAKKNRAEFFLNGIHLYS